MRAALFTLLAMPALLVGAACGGHDAAAGAVTPTTGRPPVEAPLQLRSETPAPAVGSWSLSQVVSTALASGTIGYTTSVTGKPARVDGTTDVARGRHVVEAPGGVVRVVVEGTMLFLQSAGQGGVWRGLDLVALGAPQPGLGVAHSSGYTLGDQSLSSLTPAELWMLADPAAVLRAISLSGVDATGVAGAGTIDFDVVVGLMAVQDPFLVALAVAAGADAVHVHLSVDPRTGVLLQLGIALMAGGASVPTVPAVTTTIGPAAAIDEIGPPAAVSNLAVSELGIALEASAQIG